MPHECRHYLCSASNNKKKHACRSLAHSKISLCHSNTDLKIRQDRITHHIARLQCNTCEDARVFHKTFALAFFLSPDFFGPKSCLVFFVIYIRWRAAP